MYRSQCGEGAASSSASAAAFSRSRRTWLGWSAPPPPFFLERNTAASAEVPSRIDSSSAQTGPGISTTLVYLEQLQQAASEDALLQISTILLSLDACDGIVRISQDRLAQLSGKTRRTVGAQLHRLATMGVVDLNRVHVTIKNRKRLALLTV